MYTYDGERIRKADCGTFRSWEIKGKRSRTNIETLFLWMKLKLWLPVFRVLIWKKNWIPTLKFLNAEKNDNEQFL